MQFSTQLRQTISFGQAEALRLGNDFIGTEHLLLGLLQANGSAAGFMKMLNIDLSTLRQEAEEHVQGKKLRKRYVALRDQSLPLSENAEKVILETVREAKARKSAVVDANDLVLSIVKNDEVLNSLSPARKTIAS